MNELLVIVENPLINFLPMHRDVPRPFNADFYLASADLEDSHLDIFSDADRFALFAG
jgi:hypothetical protein